MNDINIIYIRYFVALVEHGNFSKAAVQMNISQPALSKSIKTLESTLGTNLLVRFPKGFELTDAGKYFYESSVYFLHLYDDFLYDVSTRVNNPYSGTVKMSSSGVIMEAFFSEIIYKLSAKFPTIKFRASEDDTNTAIQMLLNHRIDFCTALYPLPQDLDSKLEIYPLIKSSFHVALPKAHRLASNKSVDILELDGENVLTPGEHSRMREDFARLCTKYNIKPNIICSSSQQKFLIKLVAKNIGIAILPGVLLEDIPDTLTHIPLVPEIPWNLGLAVQKNSFLSLAASTSIHYIREYFAGITPLGGYTVK